MVVAIAVAFSQPNPENNVFLNSTVAPTVSLAPSSSMAPSSSPTECVNKIISNAQELDLKNDLQIDDPHNPKVAVDGSNMVVVAKDRKYCASISCDNYDGPAYITFYTLDNNNEWQRVQAPIRVDNVGDAQFSVALSDNTAFVGLISLKGVGYVLVYELNQFNEWARIDDPFIHSDSANATQSKDIGYGIDIDRNLVCLGTDFYGSTNLYHRDKKSKWVQFGTIEGGGECSVAGNTIAVRSLDSDIHLYKYDQDQNRLKSIQELITITERPLSMDLSNNYLVYWDGNEQKDIFIYHQNETNQTFTLYRQLKVTGTYANSLALDNDILVLRGYNHTHIYSLQDGSWVESITLDESFDDIKISGRTLVATKKNDTSLSSKIHAFNIQDCTQDMPTQSPTLSPSSPPTLSLFPTTTFRCFEADDGGSNGVLYNAVRAYVDQNCANNSICDIGQTYGWPMNSWCVKNVKDMKGLFSGMNTFNENISDWDTSSVVNMAGIFYNATSFNNDLSSWNMSGVTYMTMLLWGAKSFNQDLCSWRDSFPYTAGIAAIFTDSGCTYQAAPKKTQKGPFCASDCGISQEVSQSAYIFFPMHFFCSNANEYLLFSD